ncbi:hypothetical protein Tco_1085220, partial [Tanacetum coccineum]
MQRGSLNHCIGNTTVFSLNIRTRQSVLPRGKLISISREAWRSSAELLGSDQFTLSLSQANSQRADEKAPYSLIPENIFRAVITKRLASVTGKASKDLPFGLVASFLDKSESRIRIRLLDVGSCLNQFPLSG